MRRAFTLAELLVVLALLTVVLGLLLPALQRIREAANRIQCTNHLKQLGLAALQHESTYRFLPGGGWTGRWLGEADRPTGKSQPGGWIYQILRFMEQDNLAAWGAGLPRAQQLQINSQLASQPIPLLNCPSRRNPGPFANPDGNGYYNASDQPVWLAHADYAACAGDRYYVQPDADGPPDLKSGDDPRFWKSPLYQTQSFTGVIYVRSETRITELANGTSNTYVIGEKYLKPMGYYTGSEEGDDEAMLIGMDNCISRGTAGPPLRDTPHLTDAFRFGSAHASGCNMLYADGRVELVAYSIDPTVHRKAGNRFGR